MDVRVGLWRKLSAEEFCFWTVVFEKTLESPLDCKEIQPVHPKDQSWVFFGRTDFEAETPTLWPPDAQSGLSWKDPDAGKDWEQEEKGITENEMVGWHHWLNRHGFGWTLGVSDGQGALVCCSSWGHKELYMTERLNWTELIREKNLKNNIYKYVCVCVCVCVCIHVCLCVLSHFSQIQLFATLWDFSPPGYSPWDSPGKNTRGGCHAFLQGILLTQRSNPYLFHSRQILFCWVTWEDHICTYIYTYSQSTMKINNII